MWEFNSKNTFFEQLLILFLCENNISFTTQKIPCRSKGSDTSYFVFYSIIRTLAMITTHTRATGYVAAYAAATSSVPAEAISAPSAGVLVMPPVMDPSEISRSILNTLVASK
jgi:hypothetical protein